MSKNIIGECKLCGQTKKLSYEHVPPENAFNSFRVTGYPFESFFKADSIEGKRMPWDFSGIYGTQMQKGSGGYYLCQDCNSKTGSWYISEYVKLANTFHSIVVNHSPRPGGACSFQMQGVFPLRILKAIMTLFCDINHNCFGDQRLRRFLMDKESNDFDPGKYSVYLYIAGPGMSRMIGYSAMVINGVGVVGVSEIGSYPVGSILCIDKPAGYDPPGILISDFGKCEYNQLCNVEITGLPYFEINTFLPLDYRTKEEFVAALKAEKEGEQGV